MHGRLRSISRSHSGPSARARRPWRAPRESETGSSPICRDDDLPPIRVRCLRRKNSTSARAPRSVRLLEPGCVDARGMTRVWGWCAATSIPSRGRAERRRSPSTSAIASRAADAAEDVRPGRRAWGRSYQGTLGKATVGIDADRCSALPRGAHAAGTQDCPARKLSRSSRFVTHAFVKLSL